MVYTIGIGSNWRREEALKLARRRLNGIFPGIRFSKEVETEPLHFRRRDKFSNQVAQFSSPLSPAEVEAVLKSIERTAGRLPEDKAQEIVKLDLDLLCCDERCLKPQDMERSYILQGIAQLKE
ncbi:2-amino-4-hydroxy-6-hydroxymethyldihydropteridine diphosphokinase [gut metagenome]|uniref:2-amino-4-hydroxy-6-hydroxymethyldihydropteridine diphosphokinase n=1 Tax=gut metagenome TaxID=749906 RepID=J9GJX7_9ZZZZ